jgi:integrase
MPLTDTRARNAKPKEKTYRLSDEKGMYLEVMPTGARYWRMKYRFVRKEKRLALGVYPEVSLAQARERRDSARKLLAQNIDPSHARKQDKRAAKVRAENSFEAIAREWVTKQRWTARHTRKVLCSLEADIFPDLGGRPISEITAPELLDTLRKIERRGAHDTALRVTQRCGSVFRYGIVTSRCKSNPAADLKGALTPAKKENYAALSVRELPEFFVKLENYDGHVQTRLALRLLSLTAVRTKELRAAPWSEFDLDAQAPTWRIPAERMKMRDPHIVPLSCQAVEVLRQLQAISGTGWLVFPSRTNTEKPMSENTMLYALYRMGYHGRATVHGFRATFSTICNEELRYPPDVIERQLAHAERNKTKAAYNRAQYLPERRKMMQEWADFLGSLPSAS